MYKNEVKVMKFNKKGQGLSLNVIIVAAIALIVLVLLVMIFTGRIDIFNKGVSKAGDAELLKFKTLSYGDCHPTTAKETAFQISMGAATSDTDKDTATTTLKQEITRCATYTSDSACQSGSCTWK